MREISQNEISILTGIDRLTVSQRIQGVAFKKMGNSKLFNSEEVLRVVLLGLRPDEDGKAITPQEAKRQLDIARKQEIDLGMEVTRKERIPIDDLNEVNGETFDAINGILKANVNKTLTPEILADLQALLRDAPAKYNK